MYVYIILYMYNHMLYMEKETMTFFLRKEKYMGESGGRRRKTENNVIMS